MFISRIELTHFKNYPTARVDFHPGFNILTGNNGMGKTNLLDAVYYACICKSNFQAQDKFVVSHNQNYFRLEAEVKLSGKTLKMAVKFNLGHKKELEWDGKIGNKLSEHLGRMPCVMIAPKDINSLLEGSSERRKLMDICICQFNKVYLESLMKYYRILKQRNAYLKSNLGMARYDEDLLLSFDSQIIPFAMAIFEERKKFITEINPIFKEICKDLTAHQEDMNVNYKSSLEDTNYGNLLLESRKKDIHLGRTTKGVHKDDLELLIDDRSIKIFGSQGQLKSYILGLKLAEYEILRRTTSNTPILIFDDIFDKLDFHRVKSLFNYLGNAEAGQIFVSDTDETRISGILNEFGYPYQLFHIDKGKINTEL